MVCPMMLLDALLRFQRQVGSTVPSVGRQAKHPAQQPFSLYRPCPFLSPFESCFLCLMKDRGERLSAS